MKKYAIFAVVLVLTLSLLTGCGCTAQDSGVVTMPSTDSIMPTNIPETTVPTEPATQPMTTPSTEDTNQSNGMDGTGSGNSNETGSGSMDETTTAETGARNRMR